MNKLTQTSTTLDRGNCTVMALKSVTGWQERKCQRILSEGGRTQNRGFNIEGYLADNKGIIEDVTFEPCYKWYDSYTRTRFSILASKELGLSRNDKRQYDDTKFDGLRFSQYYDRMAINAGVSGVNYGDKKMSLKRFAKENPKGAFYIIVNNHALAIIDGVIVDNLTGKMGGEGRQVKTAYKVTGNIKPNMGKLHKLDTKPKRHARLKYGETVTYLGKPLKNNLGVVIAKKGDLVNIKTQQGNGLVVLEFIHRGEKAPHPTIKNASTYPNYWGKSFKIDRSEFQVTKERNHYIMNQQNLVK